MVGPKLKEAQLWMSGDERKIISCKDQYCIGTSNVRLMNQGKLDVIKQEMERLNNNIFGVNQLKWTGMGEFNLCDH